MKVIIYLFIYFKLLCDIEFIPWYIVWFSDLFKWKRLQICQFGSQFGQLCSGLH